MKNLHFSILAVLIAFPVFAETERRLIDEVFIGDRYDDVISVMGKPSVLIAMEDASWLKYERGTIKIEDDRVVKADLITPEEANARRQQEQIQYEQYVEKRAVQKAQRIEEGHALKNSRLSDPYFVELPADRQVAFWRQFRSRYPEVPSQSEYLESLTLLEAERKLELQRAELARQQRAFAEEQRREDELRDQEARIRELEARVRLAESQTYQPVQQPVVVAQVIQPQRLNYVSYPSYHYRRTRLPVCRPITTPTLRNGTVFRKNGSALVVRSHNSHLAFTGAFSF